MIKNKIRKKLKVKSKIKYKYDFGDNWLINIEVLKEENVEDEYPKCIDGKRAGPLEDCGGVWGYYSVLEALNDPANAPEFDSKFKIFEKSKR